MLRRATRRGGGPTAIPAGPPAPARVLLVNWRDTGHPEGGGAENFLARVSAGLHELGYAVTVRCAAYPGAAAEEILGGVRFLRRGGRFTVYPRTALYLIRRRRSFDVVLDVQNGVPFWTPLFTRRPVINITHHLHREQWRVIFGPVLGRLGWWLESRVTPRIYRRCRYLTVSAATRDDLVGLGIGADRIAIVYSGVDVPGGAGAAGPREPEPNLVVLGRLVPHKRFELALKALAALRADWPTLTLTVIGQGYWEPTLRATADRLGVTAAVRFAGYVDDATKHRLLAAAWLHLMPSMKEGWGLAVVESAAQGTPTVAFRAAGGPRESVLDGRTGLLVDDEAEFVAATGLLLADGPLRRRMNRAARAHAAHFDWRSTVQAVAAEVEAVTGRPSPPLPVLVAPRQPPRVEARVELPSAADVAG